MTSPLRLRWLALVLCAFAGSAAWAAGDSVEAIVARARAYVGPEPVLSAVTSLHYIGRMEMREKGTEQPREVSGTIDLIFQKPGKQRITQVIGEVKDITGLDNNEAWLRNSKRPQTAIMNLRQLRRIQAEVFENLSFFRGAETQGGRVELRGETQIDGLDLVKVAFAYPGDVTFLRFFDKKTGRLVQTETSDGAVVREEGEWIVGGLRFPKRLVSISRTKAGVHVTSTIHFDRIAVNEKFDAALFSLDTLEAK